MQVYYIYVYIIYIYIYICIILYILCIITLYCVYLIWWTFLNNEFAIHFQGLARLGWDWACSAHLLAVSRARALAFTSPGKAWKRHNRHNIIRTTWATLAACRLVNWAYLAILNHLACCGLGMSWHWSSYLLLNPRTHSFISTKCSSTDRNIRLSCLYCIFEDPHALKLGLFQVRRFSKKTKGLKGT